MEQRKDWLGGYIRWGKRGPTYVIERWMDGKRYHVSTKCRTERAALEQLAAFESDPPNYKPTRAGRVADPAKAQLHLTAELVLDYRRWLIGRDDEPASVAHADKHEKRLEEWMVFFNGRDIRTVKLAEISAWLATQKNRPMKIQALKGFCGWLRKVKFSLSRNEDPTLDLVSPPARATKDVRDVVVEQERLFAVLPHLPDATRDAFILRLGTGWHMSEVVRFAAEGKIRRTPGKFIHLMTAEGPKKVPLLATLTVWQAKARQNTNTPILYAEHLQAAERLLARKKMPTDFTLRRHLYEACEKAGVEKFWHWHIRHSVVSNAVEQGADLEQASVFVDHVGIHTDRKHYLQLALPKKAVPVLRVLDGGSKKTKAS